MRPARSGSTGSGSRQDSRSLACSPRPAARATAGSAPPRRASCVRPSDRATSVSSRLRAERAQGRGAGRAPRRRAGARRADVASAASQGSARGLRALVSTRATARLQLRPIRSGRDRRRRGAAPPSARRSCRGASMGAGRRRRCSVIRRGERCVELSAPTSFSGARAGGRESSSFRGSHRRPRRRRLPSSSRALSRRRRRGQELHIAPRHGRRRPRPLPAVRKLVLDFVARVG